MWCKNHCVTITGSSGDWHVFEVGWCGSISTKPTVACLLGPRHDGTRGQVIRVNAVSVCVRRGCQRSSAVAHSGLLQHVISLYSTGSTQDEQAHWLPKPVAHVSRSPHRCHSCHVPWQSLPTSRSLWVALSFIQKKLNWPSFIAWNELWQITCCTIVMVHVLKYIEDKTLNFHGEG